jgi:predicted nucleic acid-binding protein
MIVVSNTSPITNLALVGQIDLLQQLYSGICIPQAVSQEIAVIAPRLAGTTDLLNLNWIQTRQVTNHTLVDSLRLELDDGEAEAIALAVELNADLVLLDERRGRAAASRLGIKCVGLLGALVEAKYISLIPTIKPILDDLIVGAGFWISQGLYEHVLQTVGE